VLSGDADVVGAVADGGASGKAVGASADTGALAHASIAAISNTLLTAATPHPPPTRLHPALLAMDLDLRVLEIAYAGLLASQSLPSIPRVPGVNGME
jgi:hypothetical protein